jgi:hypothetical protein
VEAYISVTNDVVFNSWFFISLYLSLLSIMSVFGSVVVGAFQIAFRAEMHANDVFLFFKNHF